MGHLYHGYVKELEGKCIRSSKLRSSWVYIWLQFSNFSHLLIDFFHCVLQSRRRCRSGPPHEASFSAGAASSARWGKTVGPVQLSSHSHRAAEAPFCFACCPWPWKQMDASWCDGVTNCTDMIWDMHKSFQGFGVWIRVVEFEFQLRIHRQGLVLINFKNMMGLNGNSALLHSAHFVNGR